MRLSFDMHPEAWFLLPTILVAEGVCECCDGAGVVISIVFLCFSASLIFGTGGPHQ